MENAPKKNTIGNLIIITVAVLAVAILVILAIIIYNATIGSTIPEDTEIQVEATQVPVHTEVPSIVPVTATPLVTAAPTEEPTATPDVTPVTIPNTDTVWINISYLKIRSAPDFSLEKIGHIPYGEKVSGEIDGLWMHLNYKGIIGYIYVGNMKDTGRPCVVYSEAALEPLV